MKKILRKIMGVLVITVLVNTNIAFAVTQSEINAQKQEQADNSKKQQELENQKTEVTAEKNETQEKVNELDSQIDQYESQIDSLDNKISDANAKLKDAEAKLKQSQDDYEKEQQALQQRMVTVYEAGDTSYLDFILSSNSLSDFISNYYLVSEVANYDNDLLDKIQKQKEEIENSKQQIESSKKELESSKAEKEKTSTLLKTAKTEKAKKVSELSAEEQEIQAGIDELKEANVKISQEIAANQKKYEEQIKAMEAAQKAAQQAAENAKKKNSSSSGKTNTNSGNNSGSGTYTSGGSGVLQRPVSSGTVTAGMYYSSGAYHGAIDYGVPVGTPVYAAAAGVVIKTANLTTSYGTYVVIQHAGGLQTWYAHGTSGSICVSEGQTVSRGQQIMLSGNSGHSTGAHLHFEVRVSPYNYATCRVNPTNYF